MALTWSTEDVNDADTVCKITLTEDRPGEGLVAGDTIWNPVTTALVWASIQTGIGRITEANAAEVYARINFIEELSGPFLVRGTGEPHNITPEEVHAHIGLWTNVTYKDEPRSKFFKRLEFDLNGAKARYERAVAKEGATA